MFTGSQGVRNKAALPFVIEAVQETLTRTKFGNWRRGDKVNLERAIRPMDRLGGHMVSGHVDGMVTIRNIHELGGSWRLTIDLPDDGHPYVVEKGSVALDGVSLTVASRTKESFDVEIIPHTWENSTLKELRQGDQIHIEYDMIAKYVQHMMAAYADTPGLTKEKLLQLGFGT